MKCRAALSGIKVFLLLFYALAVYAKPILTCPSQLLLLTNNQIASANRQWVFDNTYEGKTSDNFIKATTHNIKLNKNIPIKNKIDADLFSVNLRSNGATCIYKEKKTHRLLYLDTTTIYTPYNVKNWHKWNAEFSCGNMFAEKGKTYPLKYCQFTDN